MRPSYCGSPPSPAPENWCDSGDDCDCGGCARPGDALDFTSDGCAGPGDAVDGTTGDGCVAPGDALDVHTGDGCANSGDALDGTVDGRDGTSDALDGTGDYCDGTGDALDGNGDFLDVDGDGCAGPGDVFDGTGASSCHSSPSSGGICASDELGPGDGMSLPHAAFLNATFDSVALVPSCRNLVDGSETITETTLDFFLKLVPYCEQLFKLPHLGPLRAPRSRCQRLHVHNAHFYLALRHGSNKAPSSLPFTERAVCVISPASSLPQKSPRHSTPFASNRESTAYGTR